MITSANEPKELYCRKTGQPVRMRVYDACPHCGQIGHGLDMSKLKAVVARLGEPLPQPGSDPRPETVALAGRREPCDVRRWPIEVTHGS